MIEHAVRLQRVPALELGADAQRTVLDVTDTVNRVVAPVKVVVADEGLAAFTTDTAHRVQKVVRLPVALPTVFLRGEVNAAGGGQGALVTEK